MDDLLTDLSARILACADRGDHEGAKKLVEIGLAAKRGQLELVGQMFDLIERVSRLIGQAEAAAPRSEQTTAP